MSAVRSPVPPPPEGLDPSPVDPLEGAPSADPRAVYLRLRLAEVRHKKRRHMIALGQLDIEEERLAAVFAKNFPEEAFRPATPWVALSYAERMTVHFLHLRCGARRLREVCSGYVLFSGEAVTPEGWAMRISRLQQKGVLTRTQGGWSVSEDYAEFAKVRPKPAMPKTGPEAMLYRADKALDRQRKKLKPTFKRKVGGSTL